MTEHKPVKDAAQPGDDTPGGMDSAELMERVDAALVAMLRTLEADAPENQFDASGPTTAEVERAIQAVQERHHGKGVT
jgi:hypothetical protein